jgi:ABC-type lipoprotein release transport system permease subunit
MARLAVSLLDHVEPATSGVFVACSLVVAVCGWLAAWGPARRASRVDPAVALRAE